MKHKESRVIPMLVVLTLFLLFAFNVTYSYFTATAQVAGNGRFANFEVAWGIKPKNSSIVQSVSVPHQFYPTAALSRGEHSMLKYLSTDENPIGTLVLSTTSDVYVRFWIEVYMVKSIKGSTYYIDSNGNYVDEAGNYVDEDGNVLNVDSIIPGEVVDYGKHFHVGNVSADGQTFTSYNDSTPDLRSEKNNIVTYFVEDVLESGSKDLYINAIKMDSQAPAELLSANVCIYWSFDAVQAQHGAFLYEFNDSVRGYYDSWE